MKNIYKKIICISTALVMLCQGTVCAYAKDTISKNETVYVNLGLDGCKKNTIVSDWLHSDDGGKVEDSTTLDNIKNVKGDEQPEKIGDKLIWNMQGKDIYYNGTTDKELPVDVKINYYLDGNETSPDKLGGKSGRIKITIQLINKDSHQVSTSKGLCTMYTPFMVGAVVNMPSDVFKNVSVSYGKVIADGSNQIVAFASLPGLKESLGLNSTSIEELKDINLPETFEINADASNFKLGPIMFAVTSGIPELDNIKNSKNIDELKNNLNKLNNSMNDFETIDDTGISTLITNPKNTAGSRKLIDDAEKACEFDAGSISSLQGVMNSTGTFKILMRNLMSLGETMNKNSEKIEDLKKFSKYTGKISELSGKLQSLDSGELTEEDLQVGIDAIFKNKEDKLLQSVGSDGTVNEAAKPALVSIVSQSFSYEEQLIQNKPVDKNALGIIQQAIEGLKPAPENKEMLIKLNTIKTIAEALISNNTAALKASNLTEENAQKLVKDGATGILENQKSAYVNAISSGKVNSIMKAGLSQIVTSALESKKNSMLPEIASVMSDASSLNSQLKGDFGSNYSSVLTNDLQFLQSSIPLIEDTMNQYNTNRASINSINTFLGDSSRINYLKGWTPILLGMQKDLTNNKNILDIMDKFETDKNISAANRLISNIKDKGSIDDYKKMADDADLTMEKKDKLIELSDDYKIFTKAESNMSTEVKFIMKTDEIQRPAAAAASVETVKSSGGFWTWLKQFFKKIF